MSFLVAAPVTIAALSGRAYKHFWLDSNTLSFVVKSCSKTSSIFHSGTQASLKELVCMRTTFLQGLFSDRSGIGALMIYASIVVPLFVRLGYSAASPNNTSVFQGGILPALLLLLGSIDALVLGKGAALWVPTIVATLSFLGATSRRVTANVTRVPCPASAVYGVNISSAIMSVFLIISMVYDPSTTAGAFWWEPYAPAQLISLMRPTREAIGDIWPLVILPILLSGYSSVKRVKDDADAKEQSSKLLAEEVAYGFERTWAYYRQVGLLSFMSYIWGMSMVYRGVIADGKTPNGQAQYLLVLSGLLTLAHVAVLVIDTHSAPEHDDSDAIKAVERAPAGNPGVEDNLKILVPLALVGGPSLAAMLWSAKIEEIRGYKARRAWRALTAAKDK